jgi:transposase
MAGYPRTRRYVERRTGEGLNKEEIIRCLKRYVAREIYKLLVSITTADTAQSVAAA